MLVTTLVILTGGGGREGGGGGGGSLMTWINKQKKQGKRPSAKSQVTYRHTPTHAETLSRREQTGLTEAIRDR